jgi:hypothetical protein
MSGTIHSQYARSELRAIGRLFRQGLMVLACYILMLLPGAMAGDDVRTARSIEKKGITDHAEINIEDISYAGRDEYRIVIVLMNRSSRDMTLKEFGREFFIQTEKGWQRLEEPVTDGQKDRDVYLPGGKTKKIAAVVKIPLATDGLFRTFEGDISFMFAYRLKLTGNNETMKNERLYWIKPMTSTWFEREGM